MMESAANNDWVQVNNTLLPCIYRDKQCFAPLNILQNAVGILTDVNFVLANSADMQQSTRSERMHLNRLCVEANIHFPPFPENTVLISLKYLHTLEESVTNTHTVLDEHTSDYSPSKCQKQAYDLKKSSISLGKRPFLDKKPVIETSSKMFPSKKEDYQLVKSSSSSEQYRHDTVGYVEKNETIVAAASAFKLSVVRLFQKPIPCVIHDSEIYASTDSLYKMLISSSSNSSIEDLHCKLQVLTIPLYCIRNCSNHPSERKSSPKSLRYFKLRDVAPRMYQLKKLLMPTKGCAQFNHLKLSDDVYRRNLSPTEMVTPDEAPLDLSMKCHGKSTGVEPAINKKCRSRVLPLVSEVHSVSKVSEQLQLPKNCSAKRKVKLEVLDVASYDSEGTSGTAVKKKSRLEDAISRIVQGKGN